MDKVGRRNYADNNRGADGAADLSARTSPAVEAAITTGAACGWSSTARCPFRVPGVRHEDPRGNESRDLPRAHVSVFRRCGAVPPVTRIGSQSHTKQQPAGDGRALLPFVRRGRGDGAALAVAASWMEPFSCGPTMRRGCPDCDRTSTPQRFMMGCTSVKWHSRDVARGMRVASTSGAPRAKLSHAAPLHHPPERPAPAINASLMAPRSCRVGHCPADWSENRG